LCVFGAFTNFQLLQMPTLMNNHKKNDEFSSALAIVLIYIGIGSAWILGSDFLEKRISMAMPHVMWIQTAKGIFYVLTTGFLLFFLIFRYMKRQSLYCQLLHDKNRLLQSVLDNQKDTNILVVDKAMNVLVDLGSDNILGIENGVRCHFKNIADVKVRLSWFEQLNNAIVATWRNGSFQSQLSVDGVDFELSCKLVSTHSDDQPVVLLMFVHKYL
jgi:hypothetical protein